MTQGSLPRAHSEDAEAGSASPLDIFALRDSVVGEYEARNLGGNAPFTPPSRFQVP